MSEILKDRSIIEIIGDDCQKFLQSLTTNDIISKRYCYSYLLSNQGRYLFDFFVYQKDINHYFIDVNSDVNSNLIKLLTLYKLRSNVVIQDVSFKYDMIYSKNIIEQAEFSLQDTRYKKLGFRSLILKDSNTNLDQFSKDLYLIDKYNYTIIDGSFDLIKDKSIPIEYGADELNAIDYKKGCYIGQEVISRAKYQGVVRKKIYKIKFDEINARIKQGSEILDINGIKIGYVCSIRDNLAITIIREEKYLGLEQKKAIVEASHGEVFIPAWMALT